MTPRKHHKSAKQRAMDAARKTRITQWIALGVIVLVVIALAWIFLPTAEEPVPESPTVKQLQYDAPPPMTIDVDRQYYATVKMAKGGEFVIQLYPDKAPVTVNNFVFLVR